VKADSDTLSEIERLLEEYEIEVETKRRAGILAEKTARTYVLHATNFVRWCKGDFVPGERKL
jgi:hypothetical protein